MPDCQKVLGGHTPKVSLETYTGLLGRVSWLVRSAIRRRLTTNTLTYLQNAGSRGKRAVNGPRVHMCLLAASYHS